MEKQKTIKLRISNQEEKILAKQQNKSEYIRKLIRNEKTSNIAHYRLIIELSELWQDMQNKSIDNEITQKLKDIILSIENDN